MRGMARPCPPGQKSTFISRQIAHLLFAPRLVTGGYSAENTVSCTSKRSHIGNIQILRGDTFRSDAVFFFVCVSLAGKPFMDLENRRGVVHCRLPRHARWHPRWTQSRLAARMGTNHRHCCGRRYGLARLTATLEFRLTNERRRIASMTVWS